MKTLLMCLPVLLGALGFSLGLLLFPTAASSRNLPDHLTINVGDVTGDGIDEVLVLRKRSVRSPTRYQVYTWTSGGGYVAYPAPHVRTYRGYVQGDPNMLVNANIEPGDTTINVNFSDGRDLKYRIGGKTVEVTGPEGSADPGNGNTLPNPGSLTVDRTTPTVPGGYIVPRYTMRRIQMSADLWNDYYVALGGVDEAIARMEQRVNDTDMFYARDIGIAWEVTTVVIRKELTDGWGWMKKEWKNTLTKSPYNAVANAIIGFKKPGGAGAGGDIFDPNDATSYITGTAGSLATYSRSLGHEVGHTFKLGHFSSWGDAMSGSESALGSGTVERAIDHSLIALEAAAPEMDYGFPLHPFAGEDGGNTRVNTPLSISLLGNDYDGNGDTLSVTYVDAISEKNGAVTVDSAGVATYTPPADWQGRDTFSYHVTDSTGLTNRNGYVKVYVHNAGLSSHFTFEEGIGEEGVVYDLGPNQAHGIMTDGLSAANSAPGVYGSAAQLTAEDGRKASADFTIGDPMDGDLSVSLWVKYPLVPTKDGVLMCKGGAVINSRFNAPRGGWAIGHLATGEFRFIGNLNRDLWQTPEIFDRESTDVQIEADTWYHLVMTMDRTSQRVRAYVNESEITHSVNGAFIADGMINNSHHDMVIFDVTQQQQQGDWDGPAIIDDARLYNRVLSLSDVATLYRGNEEIKAGAPAPLNGATDGLPNQQLRWRRGIPSPEYPSFDVYWGTNRADVLAATNGSSEFRGNQPGLTYDTTALAGSQYYWRIDEIKADLSLVTGDVWSFKTTTGLFDPPLVNWSFEDPVLVDGASDGNIRSWNETNSYTATWNPRTDATFPPATHGTNLASLAKNKFLYQQVGTWTANTDYDVSIDLGVRSNKTQGQVFVNLWWGGDPGLAADNVDLTTVGATLIAGGSGALKPAITAPGMKTESFTLNTGTGGGGGEPLWFVITSDGTGMQTLIDNIRFTLLGSANNPPAFLSSPVNLPNAGSGLPFFDSITSAVSDLDGDTLTYSIVSGPGWLTMDISGNLTGTPLLVDKGPNAWTVEVSDGIDSVQDTLNIAVDAEDCSDNLCQNGSVCTDGLVTYSCACAAGFEGDLCETSANSGSGSGSGSDSKSWFGFGCSSVPLSSRSGAPVLWLATFLGIIIRGFQRGSAVGEKRQR
jgi:hypothetical protein